MICQEVMELMQRYVDGDLNQQETSLMQDHTAQCPDCAAMLVRLQKLSSELEQLPRVSPRFSIVDSILPELERLHAAGATAGESEPSVQASASPASTRSARPARNVFRKISGVVAAGVIVGLLLFSQPDKWLSGGNSDDAAAPAGEGNAPRAMKSEAANESSSALRIQDQSGGGEGISPDRFEGAEIEQKMMGLMDTAPEVGAAPSAGQMPALTASPALSTDSPDGMWRAVALEGAGTFQVFRNEDESDVYTSQPREGSLSAFEWKADSSTLYYTVTDAQGQQSQWQFDIATLTESER
jgi:hypothetical protein